MSQVNIDIGVYALINGQSVASGLNNVKYVCTFALVIPGTCGHSGQSTDMGVWTNLSP